MHAGWDVPLPIGYGQTNSQPTTVRLMLEWLDVQPGQKVLDVGSGSGWTSALLAHLVGSDGQVVAVEKIPELVEFGRQNCRQLGLGNIEFHQAEEAPGWWTGRPYDRILVSASGPEIPKVLLDQLAAPGKMVIPVLSAIVVLEKTAAGKIEKQAYDGFSFVPLV